MRITTLTAQDIPAYEDFLKRFDGSLLYYGAAYRNFIADLLGCGSDYWLAERDGEILGVLPTMETSGSLGRVMNSLPYYGSNGAPLCLVPEAHDALVKHYAGFLHDADITCGTIVENPFQAMLGEAPPHTILDERISHATPLPVEGDIEALLLGRFDSTARRNIKKAAKSGVTVAVDNGAFGFLEKTHVENMQEIGGNAKTPEFFAKVARHFRADSDYRIYVASIDGAPVSALLLFYFNKTVEYFTPVTHREARETQPMAAILYESMLDAARRGYSRWNWGGTWLTQDGVRRFKEKWGAVPGRYSYYTLLRRPEILASTPQQLLGEYPGFFVVPFSSLEAG